MKKKPIKRKRVKSLAVKRDEMRFTREGLERWIKPEPEKKVKKKKK